MEASLNNNVTRVAISSIIDDIAQTQRMLGAPMHEPEDCEAREIVERIERRLRSIDLYAGRAKETT